MNGTNRARLPFGFVLLLVSGVSAESLAQPPVAPAPRSRREPGPPLPAGAIAQIGQPRLTFPGSVINVAFAPSGTTFVSTANPGPDGKSLDRMVVLWDGATGREIRQFQGHQAGVDGVAFSGDGKRLATGGLDGIVRLWDAMTGKQLQTYRGHTAGVLAVAFSPSQKLIASVGLDMVLRVWDVDSAKELLEMPTCRSQGTSNVQFSPIGNAVAGVGPDFAIRLWNPETGEELKKLTGASGDSLSIDFTRDGKRLAAIGAEGVVRVWDVETSREIARFGAHEGIGSCLRFSPDGTTLATGGTGGAIRFWDPRGKLLRTATGHPRNVSEISFSADGSILASAGHEGTVRLWDTATGLELPQSGGVVSRISLSLDGKRLATTGSGPAVRFWNPESGQEQSSIMPLDRPARAIGFTSDGGSLIVSDPLEELQFWNLTTRKKTRQAGPRTGSPLAQLAIGPGGRFLATSGGDGSQLWDADKVGFATDPGGIVARMERHAPLRAMAFSPGDTHLAVAGSDGRVRTWEVATGHELFVAMDQGPLPTVLAWSADGRSIAVVTQADRVLRTREIVSGRERLFVSFGPYAPRSVAFSPDGRIIAAGEEGGILTLWDARTGERRATRAGHVGPITFLAFTPDGRFLVSAGADLTVPGSTGPDVVLSGDGIAVTWDVSALVKKRRPGPRTTPGDTESLWVSLSREDAVSAHDAICRLAACPDVSLPLLKEKLPRVYVEDAWRRVGKLLAALDDDDFEVREKATLQLIRLGADGARAARHTLATTRSREVRRRAEEVIARVGIMIAPDPREILLSRGLEVLQKMDTAESRALLTSWADGPAEAPLSREARAALAIMRRSP